MADRLTVMDSGLYRYLLAHQSSEHTELQALRQQTRAMPDARMQISPERGHLLALLARLMGAHRCL